MSDRRTTRFRPCLETLEERAQPALFGQPWLEPGRLTVSFAPDGTDVVGRRSELFSRLDAQLPRAVWQREVLRAFQTSAVHANLNLAVTPDGGQPFGSPGPTQGDPRFGDVRIGTQPMTNEALAITVPPDVFLSGTWAGDVLLNSRFTFTAANLFPVVEHEIGHVLGLSNSTDSRSPMFARLNGAKPLTPADVAGLVNLYGARLPDSWEGPLGNALPRTAAELRPAGGSAPLLVFGDVGSLRDVDTYRLQPLDGYAGPVTIRVQSAGVSLLAPAVTVFDRFGRVLARAAGTNPMGNALFLTLPRQPAGEPYYVRVASATKDVFGIGRYALAVTYNRALTTTPAALATLIRQSPSSLGRIEDDDSFKDPAEALVARDRGTDDDYLSGERLEPLGAVSSPTFTATGSVESQADVDYFRIRSPQRQNDGRVTLTARLTRSRLNGAFPRVELLDRHLAPVSSDVVVNGNGMFTFEAEGLEENRDYYVRVTARDADTGNYSFVARFADSVVSPRTFVAGSSRSAAGTPYRMYIGEPQLVQFTLSAASLAAGAGGTARFDLYREQGNQLVLVTSLRAGDGEAFTAPTLFLAPGSYAATVTLENAPGGMSYRLRGVYLSDPIGPALGVPTLAPKFTAPDQPTTFLYPGDVFWQDPYLWVLIDPSGYLVLPSATGGTPDRGYAMRDGLPLMTPP